MYGAVTVYTSIFIHSYMYTPTHRKKHISMILNLRKRLWWAGELFVASESLPSGRERDKKMISSRTWQIFTFFSQQLPELVTGSHTRNQVRLRYLLNQNAAIRDR